MSDYTDLLITQYANKPRALATIQALSDDMRRSFSGALSVPDMLDIDTAGGVNLDIIGKIVGQDRTLDAAVEREFFAFTLYADTKGFRRNSSDGSPWYRYGDATGETATLNDSEMRILIRARCIKNFSDCGLDDLERACELLFGRAGYSVDIIGPCHWQITTNGADAFVLFCAKNMDVLPRSSGMQYSFVES